MQVKKRPLSKCCIQMLQHLLLVKFVWETTNKSTGDLARTVIKWRRKRCVWCEEQQGTNRISLPTMRQKWHSFFPTKLHYCKINDCKIWRDINHKYEVRGHSVLHLCYHFSKDMALSKNNFCHNLLIIPDLSGGTQKEIFWRVLMLLFFI